MPQQIFHPLVWQWFTSRFSDPTEAQTLGWPQIAAGTHTLIAAPTGSGKTLAAFLVCIDRLFRQWVEGKLPDGVEVVYVSPLKALSNDIQRNLQNPLQEIAELAAASGFVASSNAAHVAESFFASPDFVSGFSLATTVSTSRIAASTFAR